MSTKGPQTTSVGGGREHTGRGDGGIDGMSFLEDFWAFCDGAANFTLLGFFLSFLGGEDFFLAPSGGEATSSSSGSGSSKQEMPKHSIMTVLCLGPGAATGRGDGVGLPSLPLAALLGWYGIGSGLAHSCCCDHA